MTQSPRLNNSNRQMTKEKRQLSAPMLLVATALDTTWRAFLPTIGGVLVGIGLDNLFGLVPIMTVVCLILGTLVSALLIAKQLRDVRRLQK